MADINPNWYNIFPHTCFSIANLNWLISKYGEQDDAIKKIQASDAEQNDRLDGLEERMDTAEGDIDALEGRMDTAESDIDAVEGRLDTAESDIDAVEGRLDTAESDIDAVEGRLDTAESDIDAVEGRLDTAEGDIDDLESSVSDMSTDLSSLSDLVQGNTNDITGLDSRVGSLEEHSVIANPGGTGVTLNTLAVDGTVYSVPQGGGGGGSSVTPNPAGQATADLTKVDIDGTIYAIPSGVDTSDMIAGAYNPASTYYTGMVVYHDNYLYKCLDDNVTGAWDSTKWTRTTCVNIAQDAEETANTIEQMYTDLGTAYEDTVSYGAETSASWTTVGPGMTRTLTPGSWIVTYNATFDTHELGSKQRTCNIYLDVNDVTIAQNSKYMWGTEAITSVLHENSTSLTAVVDVPYGTTKTIKPKTAVRVSSGTYSYDVTVRAGYVRIKPYSA